MSDLLTTGDLARRLGVGWWVIDRAIKGHGIKPARIVAGYRVFRESQIDAVRRAVQHPKRPGRKKVTR